VTAKAAALPVAASGGAPSLVLCLVLLWLGGACLRLTILAPPPVISLIHAELQLSETQIGLLSGIPAALFACAAVPGALFIARFGALATLVFGIVCTGAGSALRGAAPDAAFLYAATALTGFGVAVMQPALPSLVRAWLPERTAFATAVYINGLLLGEVLPVALTVPVLLPLVGSWRMAFVVWGVLCALVGAVILLLAPRPAALPSALPKALPNTSSAGTAPPRRWWPDWRCALTWRLGIMMGSVNATYFATNFFLPRYLHAMGQEEVTGPALVALNVGQIPASILLLFVSGQLVRRIWPYVASAVLCLVALGCIVFGQGAAVVAGAGLVGFAAATVLILMLALPPRLSPPDDVHRMTAAMLTIGYTCALIVPVLSGLAWDLSGVSAMAFAPIALCAIVLTGCAFASRSRLARASAPAAPQPHRLPT